MDPAATLPSFLLLSGEEVPLCARGTLASALVCPGAVALAREQLSVALGLHPGRLELVLEGTVLNDRDCLAVEFWSSKGALSKSDEFVVQVCIAPDPLERQLPELTGRREEELETLKDLNLKERELETLPDAFGSKLPNLRKLRASGNALRLLPRSFGQLSKLEQVWMDDNHIRHLPPDFGALRKLTALQLEQNSLEALPESFGELAVLQSVCLDCNCLRSLPQSVGQLRSLQKLRLVKNDLEQLPSSFGSLAALKELWLSGNKLTSLPLSFGQLSSLQQLRLARNRLKALPESIGDLKALKMMYLEENLLDGLPDSMSNLAALRALNLESNCFRKFPLCLAQTSGCLTLEKLWVGFNSLAELSDDSLAGLTALVELGLNRNQLSAVPQGLGQIRKLQLLYLTGNQLQGLPESLGQLPELRMLWLDDNKLTALPQSCLSPAALPSLQLARLNGNPFAASSEAEVEQPVLQKAVQECLAAVAAAEEPEEPAKAQLASKDELQRKDGTTCCLGCFTGLCKGIKVLFGGAN